MANNNNAALPTSPSPSGQEADVVAILQCLQEHHDLYYGPDGLVGEGDYDGDFRS